MAVTAKFVADFSSFMTAAKSAEGALDKLASAAGVTERSVDKAAKAFSGENLIASAIKATEAVTAIGGASKLTEAEMAKVNRTVSEAIQKMELLGIKAPADMVNLADATKRVPPALIASTSATHLLRAAMSELMIVLGPAAILGGLIAAAKSTLTFADQLVKASDRTGISTDALQKLGFIAEQSGNSLDELTSAISQMQNRLASGDKSAVAAVEELGLSLNDLRDQKPDQQFLILKKSIEGVENESERTRIAMDLFGRTGAAILPTLVADMDKLTDASFKMSDATVKSLDDFGDFISRSLTLIKNVIGTSVASVVDGLRLMGDSFSRLFDAVFAASKGQFSDAIKIMAGVGDIALPEIAKSSQYAAKALNDVLLPALSTNESELEKLQKQSERYTKENRNISATLPAVSDEVQRLTESFIDQIDAHEKSRSSLDKVAQTLDSFRLRLSPLITDIPLLSRSLGDTAKTSAEAEKKFQAFLAAGGSYPAIVKSTAELERLAKATETTGAKFQNFSASLKNLGPTIISAVQGGGDAIKSIGASLGQALGADVGASIATKFTGKFGQMLGSTMGPLGALAGQLLGAGMSKAIGWIKGLFSDPMKKEIEAANAEIDKLKGKMLEQGGSVDELEARYNAMGLSIREAFGGQGKQGLEALKAAQDEFNKRVEESKVKLDEMKGKLSSLQTELSGLIIKAYEMGYVFNQQGELIGFNFDKVAQVAKDFGVDLSALGPAFQQAQLTAEAQKVIDGFTLLTKSGADVGGVLVGMKDEINKIVNDSIQFGTTIPANMKPMIEELIRTGQLTDENGDKFTDLTKIKFGEPVKTEYEKINGAIETILTAMKDLIGKIDSLVSAIDVATRPRTLTVTAEYIDPGAPPGFGSVERRGGDNAQAEEGFASGTMGRYGRWFANFGSGTKTTLHGNEAVVRSDQAAAFAADMAGGDNAAMASEIAGLRADINSMLPRAIGRAVRDAMQTSGAMA